MSEEQGMRRMKGLSGIAFVLILVVSGAHVSPAEPESREILGYVFDARDGSPIEGATIRCVRDDVVVSARTSPEGIFRLIPPEGSPDGCSVT